MVRRASPVIALLALTAAQTRSAHAADPPFVVRVVDEETGRGVPLVELRTLNQQLFYTDSAGIAAITDPALMNRRVALIIRSHGYEFPDKLMIPEEPGAMVEMKPGGSTSLKIRRKNIAERLYRITGAGIYRDMVMAGLRPPIRNPLINGDVLGQDTAIATVYKGKLFWCWGDTTFPAGMNFAASCGTSELPGHGGLSPDTGIDLTYFVDKDGRAKPMLPLHRGGLVWLEGLFTVRDPAGRERLVATYTRQDGLKPPLERGIAVFDDTKREFTVLRQFPPHVGHVSSHPFRHADTGRNYWYLYPNFRVPDDWESIQRFEAYEAFTCLKAGEQYNESHPAIERDRNGRLVWGWKPNTGRMLEQGAGAGSVAWNNYRKKWIMVTSTFRTVVYSEADRPEGPWRGSKEIITHDHYTFYNPVHHPFFDEAGGRIIYLEGTYTDAFSDAKAKTPLYDYNQIMYRLRLDDPRLRLPR